LRNCIKSGKKRGRKETAVVNNATRAEDIVPLIKTIRAAILEEEEINKEVNS